MLANPGSAGDRAPTSGESVAWRPPETNRLDQPAMPEPTVERDLAALAAAWLGADGGEIAPLETAGFSGASVHEVRSSRGRFVLKPFAAGTPPERAAWVHGLAAHLRAAGVVEAPDVAATPDGRTLVADRRGRLWELVRFVPGRATAAPTAAQAAAALAALARLHRAAATPAGGPAAHAPPAGLTARIERARRLLADPWRSRRDRLPRPASGDALAAAVGERLDRAAAAFDAAHGTAAIARLAGLRPGHLPVQPVLRDVWADHVLFAAAPADRVAGFIDFHAAGHDCPAADVARLLGSWRRPGGDAPDWLAGWADALAAYEARRPMAAAERRAIPLYHAAGVVFGLENWFCWVLGEGRSFARPGAVVERIDRLLEALTEALQELATIDPVGEEGPI